MEKLLKYENRLNGFQDKNNLENLVTELKKANAELRKSRRAALNLIEDALLSKEALRQSEARLKATLDSATDYAIITTNTNGIIERWSTGAEKVFGYTEKEVLGKSANLIFTDEDRTANIPEKEMAFARENGSAIDERWHVRKDGSCLFVSGVMSPIKNAELTGYVKVARDMTDQKEAEENLKVWEERYRIALQAAQMAAWDWNLDEDKIIWNSQHYYLLGLEPDNKEKTAAYFLEFLEPDDQEKIQKALQKAVNETGIYQEDFRIRRKDNGEERWMHGFGQVIGKTDGQPARMVGVMFDITERKQLEQQKDDFIIVASHELKTPVTSIKAYSEILAEICREGNFEMGAPVVKKLNGQVERLIHLIQMLLDMSKIREGQLALDKHWFDLNQLISQCIEEMPKVPITHKLFFQEKETLMVEADRERIGQVITNLISNAIKYSPKGGRITISWNKIDDFVKISVQDEGIGIAEDVKRKIFERFFRVKDVQISTFPGMGMGLFISANIVHQHGGEVWVESLPGKGSAFYFTLPAATKEE